MKCNLSTVNNLNFSWLLPKFRMCGRMCDFGNCRAGRAALPVAGVMCCVTGAWVQADVFGLRPRLVFGGGTLHITIGYTQLNRFKTDK